MAAMGHIQSLKTGNIDWRDTMPKPARLEMRAIGRLSVWDAFKKIKGGSMPFILESSLTDSYLGRYSFMGCNPTGWFRSRGNRAAFVSPWVEGTRHGHPLDALKEFLAGMPAAARGRHPFPFMGGLVGYVSYDLVRSLESLPDRKRADLGIPDMHMAVYSNIIAVDHMCSDEAFSIRLGGSDSFSLGDFDKYLRLPDDPVPISPLDRDGYVKSIEKAKEFIMDGDLYQVNLSHRQALPIPDCAEKAYERLRSMTPSAFGACIDAGDHQVLSASPELFMLTRGRSIETRPIKGTRPRGRTRAQDTALAKNLVASEKDAAENVMIVDVERNDLGKICEFGSIDVPTLKGIRKLPNVFHLESVVNGRLRAGVSASDIIAATFPGGSITGAPKIRAMEIIEQLEPHRRGIYTGSIGYISWDGTMDMSVAIRTATVIGKTAYFPVGGGIVADSDPEMEYRETMDKLHGHAEALTNGNAEVTPDGLRVA